MLRKNFARPVKNAMAPPLVPPPQVIPDDTDDNSFYTALTQPATQANQDAQEEEPKEPENPFKALWGRLVPCNAELEPVDLEYTKLEFWMGRGPLNDVRCEHPKISGRHCRITLKGNDAGHQTVDVEDFSSNGTFVNGIKVGKGRHCLLNHGDEVSLGVPGNSLGEEDYRWIFRKSTAPITSGGGFYTHYDLANHEVLGRGTFATVKVAQNKVTGELCAVKIIGRSRLSHNPKHEDMFNREMSILQSLRHHNITRLIEYFEDEASVMLVMEMVPGGDLLENILKTGAIPELQCRIWTAQIVDAIAYTHKKRIAHRDLKPENILLTKTEPRVIKVADFGLAKAVDSRTHLKTMCGTPTYLAPEVVLSPNGRGYDTKVDCWSIGCIVFAMMTSRNCFVDDDEALDLPTRFRTRRVDWDSLRVIRPSRDCVTFIRDLIVNDPVTRMSITQARQHPWIKDIRNDPPEGWIGSQSQPSQRDRLNAQSQAFLTAITEMADVNEEDFAEDGSYRGKTMPPPSAEEVRRRMGDRYANHSGGLMEEDQWVLRAGQSGFSAGSEVNIPGAFEPSSREQTPANAMPNHGAVLSQSLAELDLEGRLDGVTVNGGETSPSENAGDSGGSFVHTSVGTPPKATKEPNAMEVDGQSWEVVQPVRATPVRPIKNARAAATTGRKAAGTARTTRRLVTPTPGNVHGLAPATTTTKRKAMASDFDSELSSAPASDKDVQAISARSKVARTTSRDSAGTARAGGRTRKSAGGAAVVPPPVATRSTRQSRASVPQGKRRPANTIRAPSGSSDEEDEPVPAAGPSTRRSAAAAPPSATPASRPSRILPVKYIRK